MFENIANFFKKLNKKETKAASNSKNAAKERLHLVLMQDRANVSADFLELMKQEIIEVIKKYIDVDESAIDVRLTNKENADGTNGAPALYANIPILNIKNDARKVDAKPEATKKQAEKKETNKPEKAEKKKEEVGNNPSDKKEEASKQTEKKEANKKEAVDKQEEKKEASKQEKAENKKEETNKKEDSQEKNKEQKETEKEVKQVVEAAQEIVEEQQAQETKDELKSEK